MSNDVYATDSEEKSATVASAIMRYSGDQMVMPEDMTIKEGIELLKAELDSAGMSMDRTFKFRPYDGAWATERVMIREFGSRGVGKATPVFGGKVPPRRKSVPSGLGEHVQVPWGEVIVPQLKGELQFAAINDDDLGPLFHLIFTGPVEQEHKIEAFFDLVEKELGSNSLYRGHAIDGNPLPDFLDLSTVDESQVIYNEQTGRQLQANIWEPLTQLDLFRELGLPVKRAVLLEGDYGTGKTLAAFLSARKAVANGWTFIYCRPQDDLKQVMATARLYAPAVVFYEDIDRLTDDNDPDKVTTLLDVFDGLKAKTAEVLAIATTNHRDRLHKGMFRPGRLDAVITIRACDNEGVKRLLKALVSESMLKGVDVDTVAEKLDGMTPAFVREAIDRSVRYAVSRVGGKPSEMTTEDFLSAADELIVQHQLMVEAPEDQPVLTLDGRLRELVHNVLHGSMMDYDDETGNEFINLARKSKNAVKNGSK